jgi:hypothetical protein
VKSAPLKEIGAIRVRLPRAGWIRDLALFNLAVDSRLRGCDLVHLRFGDAAHAGRVLAQATVVQHKTAQPVRFELTEHTPDAVGAWIATAGSKSDQLLFPQPPLQLAPPVHPALLEGRQGLVKPDPPQPRGLRRPLAVTQEGDAGLSAHQEPASSPVVPRSHVAREHTKLDYLPFDTSASKSTPRWR